MNIEIANRLVQLRKEKGYSQEELASKLGLSRQAVSKWERAEASPDTDNLILLARLYGVSLDDLLATNDEIPLPKNENTKSEDPCDGCERFPAGCHGCEDKKKEHNLMLAFPYPVLVVIVFLLLGFLGGWWHPGWMVFLTIPLYYCIAPFFGKKK